MSAAFWSTPSLNSGSILKGEGDSFWNICQSVTSAAQAATEIQQELKEIQTGRPDDQILKMRAAITVGDILHQDNDIFGNAVNLAARIESITPADEIYLSEAAHQIVNASEIQTSYAANFDMKGLKDSVKVYKID